MSLFLRQLPTADCIFAVTLIFSSLIFETFIPPDVDIGNNRRRPASGVSFFSFSSYPPPFISIRRTECVSNQRLLQPPQTVPCNRPPAPSLPLTSNRPTNDDRPLSADCTLLPTPQLTSTRPGYQTIQASYHSHQHCGRAFCRSNPPPTQPALHHSEPTGHTSLAPPFPSHSHPK